MAGGDAFVSFFYAIILCQIGQIVFPILPRAIIVGTMSVSTGRYGRTHIVVFLPPFCCPPAL